MQQPSSQHPPSRHSSAPPSGGTDDTTSELKADAKQLGSKAADRLHSEVDARKGEAASQVRSTADAIQSAAGSLDQGAPQWLRSAFEQGAQQVQRFAETLEQKDSRQILNEVQDFARQRPALFLGVAAAAGFAAARVFKAGGEQQSAAPGETPEWDRAQPWGDGEQDFDRKFAEGGRSSESQPFMARSETQHDIPQPPFEEDNPLVLGTGGEAGRRIIGEGEL